MYSDREEYLAKQIEILKKKERQQARMKNLWIAGGGLVIVALLTSIGFTLWGDLPVSAPSSELDPSSDILVEEITQPTPSLESTTGEKEATPVVEYGSTETLDTTGLAPDSLAPRR